MAVYSVSPDSVEALAAFAQKHGVQFTMLSDEGSRVIRALGLYNEHIVAQHTALGVEMKDHHFGVPYPGAFIVDNDGTVVEKRFEQHYRKRPSPPGVVEGSFGVASSRLSVGAQAGTEQLRVDARIGQSTYRPNQILRLNLALQVAPGLHVYGRPIPEGYTPLEVEIEPLDGLETGELELPEAKPFRVEGLDEQFYVYKGTVRGSVQFLLGKPIGPATLSLRVRYQACSEADCYPPAEASLTLGLEGLEPVRD